MAARFYLLVIVFAVPASFLPWLLAGLQMPPSGQADSGWNGATFKFLETLGKTQRRLAALFKRTHEVTN